MKTGFHGSNLNSSFPMSSMFFSILETQIHIPNRLSLTKKFQHKMIINEIVEALPPERAKRLGLVTRLVTILSIHCSSLKHFKDKHFCFPSTKIKLFVATTNLIYLNFNCVTSYSLSF